MSDLFNAYQIQELRKKYPNNPAYLPDEKEEEEDETK